MTKNLQVAKNFLIFEVLWLQVECGIKFDVDSEVL